MIKLNPLLFGVPFCEKRPIESVNHQKEYYKKKKESGYFKDWSKQKRLSDSQFRLYSYGLAILRQTKKRYVKNGATADTIEFKARFGYYQSDFCQIIPKDRLNIHLDHIQSYKDFNLTTEFKNCFDLSNLRYITAKENQSRPRHPRSTTNLTPLQS